MIKECLLERVKNINDKASTDVYYGSNLAIINSVIKHLSRMLNTKRGDVACANKYGLDDFDDIVKNFPEGIRELELLIEKTIERYEPRLNKVEVKHIDNDDANTTISFSMVCQLSLDNETIYLKSTIHDNGQVVLKG